MRTEEIRDMTDRDLHQKLEQNREELFNLRFQIETRKTKNHQRIPVVKRDIARMMTVLRERELMRLYGGEDVVPIEEQEEAAATQEAPARRGRRLFGRNRQAQQKAEVEAGEV